MKKAKVYRIQEKGQVTIPTELRERWGLRPGELVGFEETERGILVTRREVAAVRALDRLGDILRENEVTLDGWIASGREIRGEIVADEYGLQERP